MPSSRRDKIRDFIRDNFLFREDLEAIADGDSLLDLGLIDSTGILELVAFLEQDFGLAIADADIVPENLDSIDRIAAFVEVKLATARAA
ncbi:acyl carrier protein [Rhodoplanes sp. TEM]|uniref:Acyl carrier protein n=1 Tax=Rhodoplanes tepidamans TaxID=200616 RepID=A0ABT5J9Y1_RHOTP|nr:MULTISPECIES: acyl carrier protein [Rhodoplanes]MDC7786459.1 acyl carrier protein [Rhodoplanes tepidamans]MDC7985101.1 acyl carrier protein [Rhodoplanes sp. TEM]MDQ0357344.1 acyl carrier protein [Rhodoplanes tepidamans]